MSSEYGELRPTSGWDHFVSLGHRPCKFQLVSRLGSVTARHLVVGVSHTLRRWAEGATYIRQGDHHVGHWPTFLVYELTFITFRVTCRRREMYIGHARLQCVYVRLCVCLSLDAFPRYCTDPDVRSVVHYWADLQSVHGFRCYDNIAGTRNVSECLYSLYAWLNIQLVSLPITSVVQLEQPVGCALVWRPDNNIWTK